MPNFGAFMDRLRGLPTMRLGGGEIPSGPPGGLISGMVGMQPMVQQPMEQEVAETPRARAARQAGQKAKRRKQLAPPPPENVTMPIAPASKPALGIPPRPEIENRAMTNRLNMF